MFMYFLDDGVVWRIAMVGCYQATSSVDVESTKVAADGRA